VMPARQADGRGTHVAGGQIVSTTYVPEHTHCHTHTRRTAASSFDTQSRATNQVINQAQLAGRCFVTYRPGQRPDTASVAAREATCLPDLCLALSLAGSARHQIRISVRAAIKK
jgi:hypothetical protein